MPRDILSRHTQAPDTLPRPVGEAEPRTIKGVWMRKCAHHTNLSFKLSHWITIPCKFTKVDPFDSILLICTDMHTQENRRWRTRSNHSSKWIFIDLF
jgi:hypothetical protein